MLLQGGMLSKFESNAAALGLPLPLPPLLLKLHNNAQRFSQVCCAQAAVGRHGGGGPGAQKGGLHYEVGACVQKQMCDCVFFLTCMCLWYGAARSGPTPAP